MDSIAKDKSCMPVWIFIISAWKHMIIRLPRKSVRKLTDRLDITLVLFGPYNSNYKQAEKKKQLN